MAKKTIQNNQLTPGAFYYVQGKVAFSRVGRPTNETELENYNKGRQYQIKNPFTQLTIYDAKVLFADAKKPTLEEQYAQECLYRSSKKEYTGDCFNGINKTKNLPAVRVKNESTGEYDIFEMAGKELAQGLDVVVGMRVFKGNGNNGVSLDHILVMGDIKFRQTDNAAAKSALERFGIVFSNNPSPIQAEDVEEVPDVTEDDGSGADYDAPVETSNPFANNTAAADEEPVASDNPFGAGAKRKY